MDYGGQGTNFKFIRGVLVRVRVVCSGYVGRSSY